MFVALGAAFAIGSLAYDVGSLLAMGPGYVPLALGGLLVALGAATVVKAYVAPGVPADVVVSDAVVPDAVVPDATGGDVPVQEDSGDDRPLAGLRWRPLLLVTAAVAFFAYTVDGLGLLPAAFGAGLLAAFADSGTRWHRALLIAVCLTVASYVIFVLLLQLRLSLLGGWLGG
ncbi:tripartite tricarboxylate transporter TctB family protein [Antribacter gilvus]|uniref:tripartite tricarboxylate transporter TctB family protein n=1 Tax=Antribacter gilvus TaxID=2304675 RepID=UPI001982155B|nr:tripartite tricarboxylate transporter TctB family protein [Antribacter gilvus]